MLEPRYGPSDDMCLWADLGGFGLSVTKDCSTDLDDLLSDLGGSNYLGSPTHRSQPSTPASQALRRRPSAERADDILAQLLPGLDPDDLQRGRRNRFSRVGLSRDERTPSPSSDRRGPVADDYDVVDAIEAYARERPLDADALRQEELENELRLLSAQARHLEAKSPGIGGHYALVAAEMRAKCAALAAELDTLRPCADQAQARDALVGGALAGGCEAEAATPASSRSAALAASSTRRASAAAETALPPLAPVPEAEEEDRRDGIGGQAGRAAEASEAA